MKKHYLIEGAEGLHLVTQDKEDALKWLRRFTHNPFMEEAEMNDASDVIIGHNTQIQPPYKYVVSCSKIGHWWSDEFPFRAGIRALLTTTNPEFLKEAHGEYRYMRG